MQTPKDYEITSEHEVEYFDQPSLHNRSTHHSSKDATNVQFAPGDSDNDDSDNESTNNNQSSSPHGASKFLPQVKNERFRNWLDSFKRAETPNASSSTADENAVENYSMQEFDNDLENKKSNLHIRDDELDYATVNVDSQPVEQQDENAQLKQTIKPRHVIMMSLGTGIGTGLLVGNGTPLAQAGPAPLVIGYGIMGTCLYCIIQACGELAVAYSKVNGSFNTFPSFLVDPGFNFAVAWVYCIQWLCVCPLELVTSSMTIKYWTTKVDPDVFVVIFYVLILLINFFGAKGYAEAEFFFNCCKVMMMIGFFIMAICINTGAAGTDGYIGAKYWNDPGAFRGQTKIERFKGVMDTFVTAAFAFGATEFIALTAAEQSNPRKAIPSAAKKVAYRILLIFLTSIILIGFLVPYNSDQLMGSSSGGNSASPYVLAASLHGVHVVQHFINAVILLSVLSVANSAFYSSSRLLLGLAQVGYAPKWFDYVDRNGRPLRSMLCAAIIAVIAFCATSPKETDVFTWLLAISGLSQIFTWFAICVSHIRFRRGMQVQGRSLGELGFRAQTGVLGSYYAAIMLFLALVAQFWVALVPMNTHTLDAENFFQNYLAMPILLALYVGFKLWRRDFRLFIRAKNIDLISHRIIFDEELLRQEDEEYKEKLRNGPKWKRVVDFWC
ncbi:hypothetical protein TBLA_0A05190 [Henningerozyma blattae CBS 6284]|uniref:Amino acid permease/ SLC12A domain-containing protein n=1 Tax=Henningerozyma blattae (strain ATCC 34711 / CBS 6284 / DSM 70876 / NBRC 10599 / NRRL Y-10934 / UCD 77-7) TaxID=1071380 RepID=I2GW10_HENB6|nr:hypothetical protein TBLA_0A05190 [Tetrapisispora blattae CBS 6284]CCH58312.1 hypothetical protein TBLA_0A05190 [Tetrapisispora blattae CBS 6284]